MFEGFPYATDIPFDRDLMDKIDEWVDLRDFHAGKDFIYYYCPDIKGMIEQETGRPKQIGSRVIFGFADVDVYNEFKLTWK